MRVGTKTGRSLGKTYFPHMSRHKIIMPLVYTHSRLLDKVSMGIKFEVHNFIHLKGTKSLKGYQICWIILLTNYGLMI